MNQERMDYLEKFADLHKEGAREFGWAWLVANSICAEVGGNFADIKNPKVRYYLSLLAYRMLNRIKGVKAEEL